MARSILHAFRRHQVRIARGSVALFAATWLGLALQPCQAAAAPAAPHQELAAQQQPADPPCHGTPEVVEPVPALGDCPLCPAGMNAADTCQLGTGVGCGAASAPVLELRSLAVEQLLLASLPVLPPVTVAHVAGEPPARAADQPPPPGIPVQERYCTHLE